MRFSLSIRLGVQRQRKPKSQQPTVQQGIKGRCAEIEHKYKVTAWKANREQIVESKHHFFKHFFDF